MSLTSRFFGSHTDIPDPADVSLPIPIDDAVEIVKTDRRRWLLRRVARRDMGDGVGLTDLTYERAEIELDIPPEEFNSTNTKPIYVGFYQHHLPRLMEAGLLDYEKSDGTIYATDFTDEIVDFIEVVELMLEGET